MDHVVALNAQGGADQGKKVLGKSWEEREDEAQWVESMDEDGLIVDGECGDARVPDVGSWRDIARARDERSFECNPVECESCHYRRLGLSSLLIFSCLDDLLLLVFSSFFNCSILRIMLHILVFILRLRSTDS